jgi:cell division septation protein DedD
MLQERRQHPRLTPSLPLVVSLHGSGPGLLLDVCEGGVFLASVVPKNLDDVISLSFELPEGKGHIQATAEIAWSRDSGHLNGVRFVDLAGTSRQQLEEWILAGAGATAIRVAALEQPAEAVELAEVPEPADPQPAALTESVKEPVSPVGHEESTLLEEPLREEEKDPTVVHLRASILPTMLAAEAATEQAGPRLDAGLGSDAAPRYPIRLFLAVMLLSWALVFLGYRMGSSEVNTQAKEVAGSAMQPEVTSKAFVAPPTSVEASSAVAASGSNSLAWTDPGVVFQVAAMKEESNADALAEALQKKNLPAFVFRRGTDRLYKVAVGPYTDADAESTVKVKNDLQNQGFQPILKRWLPE